MANRAYSFLNVKSVEDDGESDYVFKGVATTPAPDRHGDIVEPLGVTFKNPLALLWQHRQSEPVGTVVFDKPTKTGVNFTATMPRIKEAGNLKNRIDEAWQSVKSGIVRAVSIGFKPIEYSRLDDGGGLRFIKSEVFELSLVTIPANEDATISVVKSIDAQHLAASGAKEIKAPAAAKTTPTTETIKKETKLDILAQIKALNTQIEAKQARMAEILGKSVDGGATMDAAEGEEFDTATGEIEALKAQIKRFETMAELQAKTLRTVPAVGSVSTGTAARSEVIVKNTTPVEKGVGFAQFAIAIASSRGNLMQAEQIIKSRFADNAELNIAIKAAVAAGTTTDPAWAAPLVDSYQRFAGDFVDFLRPQTILGKFGTGDVPSLRRVPFNISIPAQITGGEGHWVGQGKAKPLTHFEFGDVKLGFNKVANIAVLTEELLRLSNPSAEILVRDALAEALKARLDIDFVDPAKAEVANVSPASITNGLVAIGSSGNDAAAVRADIAAMFLVFITANNTPTNGVFIMSAVRALSLSQMRNPLGQKEFPEISMLGGKLEGLPVIVSQHIANDLVVLANASDVLLADDGMVSIDASREATLEMLDAALLQNSGTGAGAAAGTMVNMFQTNSVAIRAERWITWKRRRSGSVALLNAVEWGQPVTP